MNTEAMDHITHGTGTLNHDHKYGSHYCAYYLIPMNDTKVE